MHYTTALTRAEILYGIALLPPGRRRNQFEQAADAMFAEDFQDRVLPFDDAAAPTFARIATHRRRTGHAMSQIDAQIAAIVHVRNARLATRNIADFADCDIRLFNPWDGEPR